MLPLLKRDYKAFIQFYNDLRIGQDIWFIDNLDKYEIKKSKLISKSHDEINLTNLFNCNIDVDIISEPTNEHVPYMTKRNIFIEMQDVYLTKQDAINALKELSNEKDNGDKKMIEKQLSSMG